jgi:phage terminase small subunit
MIDRELKERTGTLRKDRLNPILMKPKPVKTLHVPEWLGPIATERWRWAVQRLAARGTLTDLDVPMLELFCVLYQDMRTAAKDGRALQPSLVSQLRILGESFGLTPTGRTRIHVPEQPKPKEDPDSWTAFRKRPTRG